MMSGKQYGADQNSTGESPTSSPLLSACQQFEKRSSSLPNSIFSDRVSIRITDIFASGNDATSLANGKETLTRCISNMYDRVDDVLEAVEVESSAQIRIMCV